MTCLGQMLWLASKTPNFSKMRLNAVVRSFELALSSGDFRIYRTGDGQPLACVCWVWLSEDTEERAIAALSSDVDGGADLDAALIGGDRLWFYNFIAPFGHARQVVRDLRRTQFPNATLAQAFRIDKEGRGRRFALFQGGRGA